MNNFILIYILLQYSQLIPPSAYFLNKIYSYVLLIYTKVPRKSYFITKYIIYLFT